MKVAIIFSVLFALTLANPKPSKLQFRNLYKPALNDDGKTKPGPRIIGGQEAEPHSIPYQVFLEVYGDDGGWYCGGSLISQNYVMTAGHCGDGGTEAHVTLGAHKIFEDEDTQVKIVSKEITVHPDYDELQITNDISVIKLPEAVNLTDAIQVSVLPAQADVNNTFAGSTSRISGWGLTEGGGTDLSQVLNYVDVDIITNEECEEAFGDLPDSNICASGKNSTGSCNGDSGGPVTVDNVQVGIVSFGVIYCLPGYPTGHTRVTSFLDWIANNTDVVLQ